MADEEMNRHHAPETSASTPSSVAGGSGPKATKDRQCPFCSQSFTSSSLGRHLDLYIKPRNPKPPDGKHDVDEIRKIRGGITRRQPRTSLGKGANAAGQRETSTPSAVQTNGHAKREVQQTNGSPLIAPAIARDEKRVQTFFNSANWQATGVINNLPPRATPRMDHPVATGQAQRIQEMRRDANGQRLERVESESWYKMQEAAESGRAAELALRELLGALGAAQKNANPEKLFDFDFFALTFPALTLKLLPAPSTLFSHTPFPSAVSWTISPPGKKQFEALNRKMQERIAELHAVEENNPTMTEIFRYNQHLQAAFEHWCQMSAKDQASTWQLESLRAVARADETLKTRNEDLEATVQQVHYLEAEFDRLSRGQLPREFLLHPPHAKPIATAMLREVIGPIRKFCEDNEWDPDVMLAKWKAAGRITGQIPSAPPVTPSSPALSVDNGVRQHAGDDLTMQNVASHRINGPSRNQGCNRWAQDQQPNGNPDSSTAQTNGGAERSHREEGDSEDADADADADTDAYEEPGNMNNYLNRANRGLNDTQGRNTPYGVNAPVGMNVNGKRSLAPALGNGREKGVKMYQENPMRDGYGVYQHGSEGGMEGLDHWGGRR